MPLKSYSKKYTAIAYGWPKRRVGNPEKSGKWHRLLPVILMTLGSILLANAVWPILSYELFTSPNLRAAESSRVTDTWVQTREYLLPTPKPTPKVVAESLDYTDLSNWFPDQTLPLISPGSLKTYKLSIPKLDILDAEVAVGGTNLDKHLIQYPGTANPGEYGAPVIFGHSVLRQFYNPSIKNPRRYVSIFSKIMTLAKGDKIYITSDGVNYTYKVIGKLEVKPEDTYILEQRHDIRAIKLVTCVPEGTYLRRGIIEAQLEEVK